MALSKYPDGKRALTVNLPINCYNFLRRVALDNDISVTEIILQYVKYLQKQKRHKKKIIRENSTIEYLIDIHSEHRGAIQGGSEPAEE